MSIIGSNILAGASGQGGGYTIEESLRFNASQTSYLSRTNTNSPTNNKIGTLSMWVKRGALSSGTGNNQYLIETGVGSTNNSYFQLYFVTTDNLSMGQYSWAGYTTTQVYRDPSAWYHIVLSYNSTLASNNVSLYVNNVLQGTTTVTQNTNWAILNSGQEIDIGRHSGVNRPFDGYITEVNLIDGQALDPTSFGEYNADTGVWQPVKYAGTYGTNGFYLNFSDASTTTTLGYDYSGQSNNWLLNNFSLTGTDYCSMTDTPTPYLGGGNYATWNPLDKRISGASTFANGNLNATVGASGSTEEAFVTMAFPTSGKLYCEVTVSNIASGNARIGIGNSATAVDSRGASGYFYQQDGQKYVLGTASAYGSSWTTNDIIGVAFDVGVGSITFYKNNVSQGAITGISTTAQWILGATGKATVLILNFGQRPFAYTPPTGFLPLHTGNLPDSSIVDGSKYFDALLWTGDNASSRSITGLEFQPDLVWSKARNVGYDALITDAARGVGKSLTPSSTAGEATNNANGYVSAFNADGFTLTQGSSSIVSVNESGRTYVAWNWKANGTGVSNTDGSITSTVSANQTAGFSIVSFTTNNTAGATVGHSLGAVPAVIIVKYRNLAGTNWVVYHKNMSATPQNNYLNLNTTTGIGTSSDPWNNTAPTSSVITLGAGVGSASSTNYSTYDSVAYCFAEVEGFSKMGSYVGNNSADGVFVYLGFRPRFLMIKSTSTGEWVMVDTERSPYNLSDTSLYANRAYSEATITAVNDVDILSNGFKLRNNTGYVNASQTYIYMAFAETDFAHALAR